VLGLVGLGLGRLDAAGELLDLALGRVQALAAEAIELLATLPEPERFVQGDVAALEPLDDLLQLTLSLLEGALLCQLVSSTRAPKPPSASSTSMRWPGETAEPARTISSPARTMA
jgi:hypothetical protein